MRQYLEAYDLFEVLAVNLMVAMKKSSGIDVLANSLKEIEDDHDNIYPSIITDLENCNPENQTTMFDFIYQYEDVNEELNLQDCADLYEKCMDQVTSNKYTPFYKYFPTLNNKLQLKLEKYLINPFLTEEKDNEYRNKMFKQYIKTKGNKYYAVYNEYLPQQRVYITVHMLEYCRQHYGGGHESGYGGGHESGYGGGHASSYGGGHESGYGGGHASGYGGGHSYGTGPEGGYDGYQGNY
uniref:Uncharacterized protein n=1 Tax=Meloidogyne javanica TaxID=6303 RepID=A0A915LCA6_MELJA